ncbi:hypothetical protein [Geothrix fuzhouensis]|uniref:hypothetical protein n=1 Tax=Geothrix fuzhouensis TaxID=2966451 RepID=UPI002147E16D|nr:hypothetical protein [Geothrix fuzhouensis]
MPQAICRLCLQHRELKESHIIPAFVFRWLKETSGTGYLRFSDKPNLRAQDGVKEYWLCGCCEQLLAEEAETPFANEVFHPLCSEEKVSVEYGPWMLKFAVSLSWRAAHFLCSRGELTHFDDQQKAALIEALERWRLFLLGQVPHPGKFEQHILPLHGEISDWPGGAPPNLNRWAQRNPEMDIASSPGTCYVYVKLPRFLFFGFIKVDKPKDWMGTKVRVKGGRITPSAYQLPAGVGNYLKYRMIRCSQVQLRISVRQKQRINQTFRDHPDRVANSDAFRALRRDVLAFGKQRVLRADDET